ncbi:MAG TPA: hypothetical protein VMX15_00785 [Candidatus Heimdallarchaeota archaeon]|nr:hypothetical protein [Candidatus Heimdallarchaeota archaeon]
MKQDASVYWLNAKEEEIHFIDAVISAYDGLANIRRDYRLQDGSIYFKVYVAPGMEDEFLQLMERLRRAATIGDIIAGEDDETPSTA